MQLRRAWGSNGASVEKGFMHMAPYSQIESVSLVYSSFVTVRSPVLRCATDYESGK